MTDPRPLPERSPVTAKTLLGVSAWGATTATLAYVIGRGTVPGMVAVFVVIGVGQRVWAHWYRKRHNIATRAAVTDAGDAADRLALLVIGRADELAGGPLSGVEQAAGELAELAGGDVEVISRAQLRAAERAEREPTMVHKQVVALIRQAIEVGRWDWDADERAHRRDQPGSP